MDEYDRDTGEEELVKRFRTFLFTQSLLTPNKNEELLLNKLQGLVTNIKWSPTDATDLFNALLKRFERSTTNDRLPLPLWMLKMLHCIEINYITPSWRCQTGTLIELVRDETVTDENLKKCLADDTEKNLDEILEEIRQQKLNQIDEKLLDDVRDIVSSVDEDLTLHNNGSQQSGLKKDLLELCQAAEKTHFRPRLTQMVSWCIMALSKTGRLVQVGTGEGKSCIVAMFAAFRAMRGDKVDIMSSSPVLAERDLKDWREFYKVLNISVDCNTNKQDKDLKKCYKCQVVYGTVEEFAGDWLRHHFKRTDIFGQRQFQCAIVDEVDSLMLDKGLHVVYISSDMPALQHLNPLLAFIWATANQFSKISTETTVGRKYPFHHVVLENITKGKYVDEFTILQMAEDTGILGKGSVRDLRKNPSLLTEKTASVTANQLAKFFETAESRFPSCQFALHCVNNDGAIEELNKGQQIEMAGRQRVPLLLRNGGFCQYMYSDEESVQRAAETEIKRALHFTPCELSQDKSSCYVPGFLSDLVKSKLKVWIENAFYAQTMTMDHEYIAETHGIVPVDYSCTGVVENNMKWSDGLQQFLEMKHQSKLSDMTAITNYMSNVGLLQKYEDQIFGISGTLGQQAETETLQKIYKGIKTCQIPSFKRRKLFEVEGVIVDDEKEWIEKICHVVNGQTNSTPYRDPRAVLVICETINRAKVLHKALGGKVPNKKLYISNNMDNSEVFKELQAGNVIIATNLAGRGTDLKVSDDVKKAGGLFVLQTFLPKNARVEAQAFGRTARQGSPGSAQLVVCSSHLSDTLKLLALMGKLQYLLENITDVMPVYQDLFVKQLQLYPNSQGHDKSQHLLLTLWHILTKTSDSRIKTVKIARNYHVQKTFARFLECDIPVIKKKEELFSQYLDILDEVYKNSNNKPADSDLSALNEFWGMWLLTNFNEDDSIVDLKKKLTEDLKTARQKLRWKESPSSNLHHYTAFGNELQEKGHLRESIKMYTKAIQEDHCWAAFAYYNRAFASLTQKDGHQDPSCIDQALEDLQNALRSVELYCEQIEVTWRYSKQQIENLHSDSDRFDSHIKVRYQVLLCLKKNINEATGKLERTRDTGGVVKLNKKLVYFLVSSKLFLPMVKHTLKSLNLIYFRDPLKMLQLISDPSFDISIELKCLESLGLSHVYTLDTLPFLKRPSSMIHSVLHRVLDRVLRSFKCLFK
ncbi:protein translocase subunit SecA-like [Micropterus salmoides]|uniref:protein translocase subunit SecA-like n=1 Tax=Micropterus salmoides TaxID=27706 RepID=UPI0018EC2884|nr:protein translocase subunit SecA-like [Micropterus salmoides]